MNVCYLCAKCGREIKEGEFIAVVGKAPAAGISAPIGRADKLFEEMGNTYCAECVASKGVEKLVAAGRPSA